jgi:hypothetical protein
MMSYTEWAFARHEPGEYWPRCCPDKRSSEPAQWCAEHRCAAITAYGSQCSRRATDAGMCSQHARKALSLYTRDFRAWESELSMA